MPPLSDRRDLAEQLHGAVSRGEIFAEYQPQADLATGAIVAVESLVRWRHPELGIIPPSNFIPLAEDNGAIHEIGRFMLDEGLACAARFAGYGVPLGVSINVSPVQLRTSEVVDYITANLDRQALPPHAMTIEITESLPHEDLPAVVARLTEVRALGVGVSIDDVGAGHSTLALVDALPASEVKLDLTLVHQESAGAVELMMTIINSVTPDGVTIVAEGIETVDQLALARDLGCHRGQGYLIGRAMSCEKLEALLEVKAEA